MNSNTCDYDFFIIGGGSGGIRAARVAASLGARVALAEERHFGGTCVNVGCVPKKLMNYAARYHDDAEDSRGFGWHGTALQFNWATFKNKKDKEINRLEQIYRNVLESNQVEIFKERAKLLGNNRVQVGDQVIHATHILIATGGWPWIPQFEGSELALTSNDLFSLDRLPKDLVVLGGGYIAVEFASIFVRLGCPTRLIYRGSSLLNGFDEDVRAHFTVELGKSVPLFLNRNIKKITGCDNDLTVFLDDDTEIRTEAVLAATGRRPNTTNLGLDAAGVQVNSEGAIAVNDHFQTSAQGIYAVGDVIDRLQLTPVALAEGEWLARHLFGSQSQTLSYSHVPSAVFSFPQIATVGISEEIAKEQGVDVDIYSSTVQQLKHTLSSRDELSFIKLVVNRNTDQVLGVHMMGPDAGEILQGFAVALNCGATKADFDRTIGIHPSLAEELVTMRKLTKSHVS